MAIEKDKAWMNSGGNWTKKKNIPKHLILRDKTACRIMKKIAALEKKMRDTKSEILQDIDAYVQKRKAMVNVKDNEKAKGNLVISDYANLNAVEISVNDMIQFDDGLNIAKSIIDKCLKKWSAKGNENIKAIVDEAFNVDKKGRVNIYMLMRLKKIRIADSDWKKAMILIDEAQDVVSSRKYLSFRRRATQQDNWNAVNLNFSSLK